MAFALLLDTAENTVSIYPIRLSFPALLEEINLKNAVALYCLSDEYWRALEQQRTPGLRPGEASGRPRRTAGPLGLFYATSHTQRNPPLELPCVPVTNDVAHPKRDSGHGHAWERPMGIAVCVASGVVFSSVTCNAPRSAWRPPPARGRGSAVVPGHASIHQ